MMADGSVFDQWQKDAFFSAAEEVQESVDSMESVYRMWVRNCVDGFKSDGMVELQRELQITMGTEKWQLEELERAINLSYESYTPKDSVVRRHSEFVVAMKNQISLVEKSLSDYLVEKGDELLHWIQLSEEERHDLMIFLSASPPTIQESRDKAADKNLGRPTQVRSVTYLNGGLKETATINKDTCLLKAEGSDRSICENEPIAYEELLDGRTGEFGLSSFDEWKFAVAEQQNETEKSVDASDIVNHASMLHSFLRRVEATMKSRWPRSSCVRAKDWDSLHKSRKGMSSYLNVRRMTKVSQGISYLNDRYKTCLNSHREDSGGSNAYQLVGRVNGLERQIQGTPNHWLLSRFYQIVFLLMLTIFLIGKLYVYVSDEI